MVTEGVGKKGGPQNSILVPQTTVDRERGVGRMDLMQMQTAPSDVRMRENLALAGVNRSRGLLPLDQKLQISGIGVDENIVNVLSTLKFLERAGTLPTKVNMMGWSRGAVTCIRIAHFMNLDPRLQQIPVNIFAVDPVAGEGHDVERDAHTINANVKNYIATLAVHENRNGFTPMDMNQLQVSGETCFAILPLPGIHSDTAKFESASGRLTFHMCYKFLKANGTDVSDKLKSIFSMAAGNQLAEYDKLLEGKKKSRIKESQSGFVARFITGRTRRQVHGGYSPDTHFFLNAHHKAIFRETYPTVYRKFFTGIAATKSSSSWQNDSRRTMFEEMQRMGPGHRAQLDEQLSIGAPPVPTFLANNYEYAVINNELI
jgi:hypothetical protein